MRKTPKQKKKQQQPAVAHVLPRQEVLEGDHDPIQESSSQSSVDNPGPLTPSPQEPERTVNTASEMMELDPHFARLLSSLTMSASSNTEIIPDSKTASEKEYEHQVFGSPTAHNSDVSDESPVVSHVFDQNDWSSSAPSNHVQPITNRSPRTDLSHTHTAVRPSPPSVSSDIQPTKTVSDEKRNRNDEVIIKAKPSITSPLLHTSTPQTAVRRPSGTADISPYLTKATEVPTSAKTLQQLSLLEAVAEESARLAPLVAARAAAVSRGPIPTPYSMPTAYPASQQMQNTAPLHTNYPVLPSSAAGFHPRYPASDPMNAYYDPFQVRSRTSQAFHRPPMHNPTGSVSMNQNHLLAAFKGSRGGPISPGYQAVPQFLQQQQLQQPHIYNANMPFYGNPNQMPYQTAPPPMHAFGMPPTSFPPQPTSPIRSYPTVAPNVAPNMSTAPINPQSTSSLLSILNGRSTTQTTVLAPVHQ